MPQIPMFTTVFTTRTRTIYAHMEKRAAKVGDKVRFSIESFREMLAIRLADPRCPYCGYLLLNEATFSVDHVLPLSRGGKNELDNLTACCRECNHAKGSLTAVEFMALLALLKTFPEIAGREVLKRMRIGGAVFVKRPIGGKR